MKRIRVDTKQCTGCESCVLTCAFGHTGAFALPWSRIRVERNENEGCFAPRVCVQCEGRLCVAACPAGALSVESQLGIIRIDEALCTSCRACENACPFSGIHFVESHPYPLICDLCGGRPACVETCQKPEAIRFEEEGDDG